MKSRVLVSLLLMAVTCSVIAAGDFEDIPNLPEAVTIARESHDGKLIRSPYSPFVQAVLDELYGGRSRDVFDLRGKDIVWSAGPNAGDILKAAKLKCPAELECITMRTQAGYFLITFTKNYKQMIDHSLIYVVESYYNEERGQTITEKTLHTIFGWGGLHLKTWPIDVEETGIFCSQIIGRDNSGFPTQTYKRRISPEGKIENKQIDSLYDCKAPW